MNKKSKTLVTLIERLVEKELNSLREDTNADKRLVNRAMNIFNEMSAADVEYFFSELAWHYDKNSMQLKNMDALSISNYLSSASELVRKRTSE